MSQREAFNMVYKAMTERFFGSSWRTYVFIYRLFEKDLDKVWERGGFAHCIQLNRLLKRELINTGEFTDKDIRFKWTAILISPHEYAQVKMGKFWMDVDVWGAKYGIRPGTHAGW